MTDPAFSKKAEEERKGESSPENPLDEVVPGKEALNQEAAGSEYLSQEGANTDTANIDTLRHQSLDAESPLSSVEFSSDIQEYKNPHSRREIRCEKAKLEGCIEKAKDPDALVSKLNELAEKLDRNLENPVAGKIKDKSGEVRVLSGPILDCALELKHVRKLIDIALTTIERAHYERPGKETASIKMKKGHGDIILTDDSLDTLRWYKSRLLSEFHEVTHEFPRHSEQLEQQRIRENPSFYKEIDREWKRPVYVPMKKRMKDFFTWPLRKAASAVTYPFRKLASYFRSAPVEAEKKITKAEELRQTLKEPNFQKQFEAQYQILESIKGKPVARARYALILAGEAMDAIRRNMAGLYYSDKKQSASLAAPQKGAPVARFQLTAEVARKKHAFLISTKGVQGIEKLPEGRPRPIRLKDTLMFNKAVQTALENTLFDTIESSIDKTSIQQAIKDLQKGRLNEVELIRDGAEISVLVQVGDKTEKFFLGYTVKEEGFTKLITPNLKGLQKLHKSDDIGLEDVVLQYVDTKKEGVKRPELMVLQSDRITDIKVGAPQEDIDGCVVPAPLKVNYHTIDYSPSHTWFARSFGGTRVKTEFFRKATKAIDDLKAKLDDSRFVKQQHKRDIMISG